MYMCYVMEEKCYFLRKLLSRHHHNAYYLLISTPPLYFLTTHVFHKEKMQRSKFWFAKGSWQFYSRNSISHSRIMFVWSWKKNHVSFPFAYDWVTVSWMVYFNTYVEIWIFFIVVYKGICWNWDSVSKYIEKSIPFSLKNKRQDPFSSLTFSQFLLIFLY